MENIDMHRQMKRESEYNYSSFTFHNYRYTYATMYSIGQKFGITYYSHI